MNNVARCIACAVSIAALLPCTIPAQSKNSVLSIEVNPARVKLLDTVVISWTITAPSSGASRRMEYRYRLNVPNAWTGGVSYAIKQWSDWIKGTRGSVTYRDFHDAGAYSVSVQARDPLAAEVYAASKGFEVYWEYPEIVAEAFDIDWDAVNRASSDRERYRILAEEYHGSYVTWGKKWEYEYQRLRLTTSADEIIQKASEIIVQESQSYVLERAGFPDSGKALLDGMGLPSTVAQIIKEGVLDAILIFRSHEANKAAAMTIASHAAWSVYFGEYTRLSESARQESTLPGSAGGRVVTDSAGGLSWSPRARMRFPRAATASAVWGGRLFVFAGHHSTGAAAPDYGRCVEAYDPATDRWTTRAVMPRDSYNSAAATLGDSIYLVGGVNTGGNYSWNAIDRYDPVRDTWTAHFDEYPASGIEGLRIVTYGSKLYLLGGRRYSVGRPYEYLSTVYAYDPSAPKNLRFTRLADMPSARADFAAVVIGSRIYCTGGASSDGPVRDTWAYAISENRWRTGLEPIPQACSAPACAAIGGCLYVVNGEWKSGSPGSVADSVAYRYEPDADTWSQVASPATARLNAAYGAIDGKLYVAGGNDWTNGTTRTNCTDKVEVGTTGR